MKSYFRFLLGHKSLTLIQILGITIALSFAIPAVNLLLSVQQMKHDNPDYKNIYGVKMSGTMSFEDEDIYLSETYPEVESASMFVCAGSQIKTDLIFDDVVYSAKTMYANEDIADFFPLEMVSGSIESISEANNVILSKRFASTLSDDNLIGKTISINDKAYVVSGILDGFKSRRMPDTDIILSLRNSYYFDLTFWAYTFVKIHEGVDVDELARKVSDNGRDLFANKLQVNRDYIRVSFTRYDDMVVTEDFSNLNSIHVTLLMIVLGAVILLLFFALSNYANLSIAMATRRAKEMATRQLLGSSKADIWRQIILENIVFTAICFILGYLLSTLSSKMLGSILDIADRGSLLNNVQLTVPVCVSYLLLILIIGTLTGLAPARIISRYSALDVVRGEFRAREKGIMSKILIISQGMITVLLLFASIVEMAQLKHNTKANFGCEIDDVCSVILPYSDDTEKRLVFDAVSEKTYVKSIGFAEAMPGFMYSPIRTKDMYINTLICEQGAFDAFDFKVSSDYLTRGQSTLWVTEELRSRMGENSAESEYMSDLGADVIGGTIEPFLSYPNMLTDLISVEVRSGDSAVAKEYLVIKTVGDKAEILKDLNETVSNVIYSHSGRTKVARCSYLRELYNERFLNQTEPIISLMRRYIVVMMILSLLGILGVSIYNMRIRKHDIAIRKLMGSSIGNETMKNTLRYSGLMAIANAIGLPVGYLLGTEILKSEPFKISVSPWMFIVTFLFTMVVVIVMCMIQSYHAASANPVDSIKSE